MNISQRRVAPLYPSLKPKETESFELLKVEELKFFEDAFQKLEDKYSNLYKAKRTSKCKKLYERYCLANLYFSTLIKVGCRPGVELLGLTFSDIVETNSKFGGGYFSWSQLNLKINSGKMSKRNGFRVIPAPVQFSIILDRYCNEFYGLDYSTCISKFPDKQLFSYADAKSRILDFDDIYNDVRYDLRNKGLLRENIKIAAYSFRHTFITFALVQKMDVYLLAENCGNSVNIIQKTYSKLAASMRSAEIYEINLYASLKNTSTVKDKYEN